MSWLRLAYFSPLPPARSGIADYSATLIPYLADIVDVTVFVEQPETVPPELQNHAEIALLETFPERRWAFDMPLYHMGNNVLHAQLYQMALRYGGIVVLHDYGLHHFMWAQTAAQGKFPLYARELGYAAGAAGWQMAQQIQLALADPPVSEEPLNGRLIGSSLGVIAHSDYIGGLIQERYPSAKTKTIPMLDYAADQTKQPLRHELPVDDETVIFMSAGYMTPAMQIEMALEAFAQVRQEVPHVHYVLAGKVHDGLDLDQLLARLNIADEVTVLGYIEEIGRFARWLVTADVLVNLRYPTLGETSAVGIRGLAAGRPLIVFDHGWYGELPHAAAVKVPVMDEAMLVEAMRTLALDTRKRQGMGLAAQAYMRAAHRPEQVAEAYVDFVEQILNGLGEGIQ